MVVSLVVVWWWQVKILARLKLGVPALAFAKIPKIPTRLPLFWQIFPFWHQPFGLQLGWQGCLGDWVVHILLATLQLYTTPSMSHIP